MLIFLTSNEDKFREVENILDRELERRDVELEEIQAVEIEEVIKHKLRQAYELLNEPVLVEDTGLFIHAWNRLPGALTKFFLKKLSSEKICGMVDENRKASAETYVGYKDGEDTRIFKGTVKGRITEEPRGEGFGWDPIFQPEGYERTFGEMPQEEKNQISMRKKALEKLNQYLSPRG
ncbi:MAG: RdgB/HAM1 family non-canonical purine NTP pyrophosphatase [Candidatus Aenigmatarchaeota archaeon]